MRTPLSFFALAALLLLFACQQPGANRSASAKIVLPALEQGLVNQFHRAEMLIPDSLEDERKSFLEDSLTNVIDQWLSDKSGLKADRWIGVVMNDTVGQSIGGGHESVLQLYIPVNKTVDTATAGYEFIGSVTVTMSVDEDDREMVKARKQLFDGDTVVFSGFLEPMSQRTPDIISSPGRFLASPMLDLTPTELYKKGTTAPAKKPEPDTAGFYKAPVKATAKLTISGDDKYRSVNIKVSVTNTSDKPVSKVIVRWQVQNKDGQPAKVMGATGAWQQGYFNEDLQPGQTTTGTWTQPSPDGVKIRLIFPKWVTYYNGLKWKAGS